VEIQSDFVSSVAKIVAGSSAVATSSIPLDHLEDAMAEEIVQIVSRGSEDSGGGIGSQIEHVKSIVDEMKREFLRTIMSSERASDRIIESQSMILDLARMRDF